MPAGLPKADDLISKKVCAFSLDTSVIEAAGFRFMEGPLHQLSGQLPPWLQLWMSDIVLREVAEHRMDNVSRGAQQIQSGIVELQRHIGSNFVAGDMSWLQAVRPTADEVFNSQISSFIKSHGGVVIKPNHERLSTELFHLYFDGRPPFGGGKDKKHEFPDAASLLSIEYYAAERGVQIIAVSKDLGWKSFAENSAHIYCVSSLAELTAQFMSDTSLARQLRKRLGDAFAEADPYLRNLIKTALENGLISLPWRVKLPNSSRYKFDAEVIEARLKSFEMRPETVGVWITSNLNEACVAETPVELYTSLRIEVVAYEFDDHGQRIEAMNAHAIIDYHFEVKIQIAMSGDLASDRVIDLVKGIELGDAPIELAVGRDVMSSRWLDEPSNVMAWDEFGDDIPF